MGDHGVLAEDDAGLRGLPISRTPPIHAKSREVPTKIGMTSMAFDDLDNSLPDIRGTITWSPDPTTEQAPRLSRERPRNL